MPVIAKTLHIRGAERARVAAVNGLKALVVTAPVGLREQLRGLTATKLVDRCSRLRPGTDSDVEVAATKQAMRLIARRILSLADEVKTIDAEFQSMVEEMAPALLEEFGVGPVGGSSTDRSQLRSNPDSVSAQPGR